MTGLLLAGIGHVDQQQKKNFLIVDSSGSLLIVHARIWQQCLRAPNDYRRNADEHD